jgi:hypothetical protein
MKLRIRENTIRLRLTQGEVAAIAEHGAVEAATHFGPATFVYMLRADLPAGAPLAASLETVKGSENDEGSTKVRMVVRAATDVVRAWALSEESEAVGFEGNAGALHVLVEKDYACLKPRRGEDDEDAFPNPNSTC